MDLTGTLLGQYRVGPKIGEGGMGVVYRAHDLRLGRSVALKFIRPEVAAHADRLERFRREALLLAALNHPNIAAIYGLEEQHGQFFLVLELVEGETLAQRIRRGPLSPREAVQISRQIVKALTEAHEKGIIHRDLKPANIKLKADGGVKILDFGVAKAMNDGYGGDASTDTREGTVIGTPGYMSPEQVMGDAVTPSSDIWAFGCVLLEMLSGERAFRGDTPSQVRAAVLRGEAHWASLDPDTPAALQTLVKVCLEVDPQDRLRHIGDARLLLDAATAESGTGIRGERLSRPTRKRWPAPVAIAVAGVLVAAGFWLAQLLDSEAPAEPPMRLAMAPPPGLEPVQAFGPTVAISPDGRTMVFAWTDATGSMLYLKRADDLDARPIAGTRGARCPFFSPDGQWIGFSDQDDRTLKRVSVGGGEPAVMARTDTVGGAAWAPDGDVVFAAGERLFRVPSGGGEPVRLTTADSGPEMWPDLLPGGRVVLFSRLPANGSYDDAEILAVDIRGGTPRLVLRSAYYPRYAPTGHLIFVQGTSVLAAPFDVNASTVTGPAVTLVEDALISAWEGYADVAFSQTGTLAYVSGGPHPTSAMLASVDRLGTATPLSKEARAYRVPRVSPDGRQVALTLVDQQMDIWTYDVGSDRLNRVTDAPSWESYPIWDPSMRWLAFASTRDGAAAIFRQDLQGNTVEKLVQSTSPAYPDSWVGHLLSYEEQHPDTGYDLWVYSFDSHTSAVFLRTAFNESNSAFSPDGRFIAYESDEAGDQLDVYVRPYPSVNPRTRVSVNGGESPRWSADGRELYYRVGRKLMVVPVKLTPSLEIGRPRELFAGAYGGYDPWQRGQAFVMVQEMGASDPPTKINIVLNWFDDLRRARADR